ncbi:MAG: TolC family protein [Candidatus Acidiferrales bacterium]
MKLLKIWAILCVAILIGAIAAWAQTSAPGSTINRQLSSQNETSRPPGWQDFQPYMANGKLQMALEDAIRLALSNDTDIHIDQQQIGQAKSQIDFARAPFDPLASSSFNAERSNAPAPSSLQGSSTLSQTAQIGVSQTLETGTNYQASLFVNKFSTNNGFYFTNPSDAGTFTFTLTQPLLRGRGLLPNRGPILIAQRNLALTRAQLEQQVSQIVMNVVQQYWLVVEARENLVVQKKSLAEAQQTYDQDKRALQLGALPPLGIYQSEAQVAAVRVSEIQAEYTLKQMEDALRRSIGADLDPNVRALDLNLTEQAEPTGSLMSIDISTALQKAIANRPELEVSRQQLAIDDTSIRIAHNGLEPNLSLSATYASNGLGGNLINDNVTPPVVIATSGWPDALNQVFHFGYPTYGATVSLTFPFGNHAAEATLASAEVSKRRDAFTERENRQQITQDVVNGVHGLEEAELSMEAAKISLNLSQKNLEAQQRQYQLGGETVFFVLTAQTQLAQAEQTLVQADVSYQLAVASMNLATGDILDQFHVQMTDLAK